MTRPKPPCEVFWYADLSGHRLLHVSPAIEQLFGLSAAALMADPLQWNHAVVAADVAALPRPFFADDLQGCEGHVREYRIIGGDLHTHWIRDRRFHSRDPKTGEMRCYGIAEDVTTQVAQRDLLAQAPLPDGWFSMVAHELRAPLHAIQGWAHVLRQSEPASTLKTRAIDTIERNVLAQARVVDELIDSQHWHDGSLKLDIGMVSLAPLIDAAAELLRSEAEAQKVQVAIEHDASIGAVRGDGERLRLVLTRLLSNGLKSTAAGGRVDVRSERVPGLVRITVHDGNSAAIPPTQLPLLFEPPQPGDDPCAHRYGSLGLPLVRQLVELHGGRVAANSDGPGFGATITVELPDRPDAPGLAAPSPAAVADPTPTWTGKRVMLVDDDRDACEPLALILRQAGAEPCTFNSAADAFGHLEHLPVAQWPHLLVSDIGMPGESGYVFIHRLRQLERERSLAPVPSVALTAFAGPTLRDRALEAGFDDLMGKPIQARTVLKELSAALRQPPQPPAAHRGRYGR